MLTTDTKIKLQNETSVLEVDLYGGAITDFHLQENPVNPLSFRFSKEQMPDNNKSGAVYQGQFLCAGRWGEPSPGEIAAGIPNHGEPANIDWNITESNDSTLTIETTASLEGLHILRNITTHDANALCYVTETITNINPLGRLFNVVQHPTIAAPFLDGATVINCNADIGFDYQHASKPEENKLSWQHAVDANNIPFNLQNPQQEYNSVFSFSVNSNDEYGWITAYSPSHQLVLGYVWQRKDYPWLNLWQHFENGIIKYRGLEFGTTGLHLPFKNIIENNTDKIFNESTVAYIDAGEKVTKEYAFFLLAVKKDFQGIERIEIKNEIITAVETSSGKQIEVGKVNFTKHHER